MNKYCINELLAENPLGRNELDELGKKISDGDEEAGMQLKKELVCLGVHIVQQYSDKRELDFDIMLKSVGISWFEELQKYFCSYDQCVKDILAVLHSVENIAYRKIKVSDGIVKISAAQYNELSGRRKELKGCLGREPSVEELTGTGGIPKDRIEAFLKNELQEEEEKLKNRKKVEEALQNTEVLRRYIADGYWDEEEKECWMYNLSKMSDREKAVLVVRLRLNGNQPGTIMQTAKMFGVTPERIRKIEMRFFRRHTYLHRNRRIKEFLE